MLQAAAAMSAYTDWAPKDIDEAALQAALSVNAADNSQAEQALPETSAAATEVQAASGFAYDSTSGELACWDVHPALMKMVYSTYMQWRLLHAVFTHCRVLP